MEQAVLALLQVSSLLCFVFLALNCVEWLPEDQSRLRDELKSMMHELQVNEPQMYELQLFLE